ncbi:MAG: ABC transporter permease [Clostridiales bacterium]|nr:ABC transporter permease [Clostridiales bacterium]
MERILGRFSMKTTIKNVYVFSVLVLIYVIFTSMSTKFIGAANIVNILRQSVPLFLVGGAVTLLMISGHIDLSVGGILGFSSVVYSLAVKTGMSYFAAGLITLLLGTLIGFINGYLVMKLNIVPLIATLATMSLSIGIGKLLTPRGVGLIKHLPRGLESFMRTSLLFGLPPAFYVAVIVVAILVIIQKKTVLGKYAAAIGGNRTAAELSGINVVRNVWLMYVIVGFCSALAGIARTSYLHLGDPETGQGMEMDAMIVSVLGGTHFFGGEGSVWRTMVGVLVLMSLTAGMQVAGVPPYWHYCIRGVVLIFALLVDIVVKEKIID